MLAYWRFKEAKRQRLATEALLDGAGARASSQWIPLTEGAGGPRLAAGPMGPRAQGVPATGALREQPSTVLVATRRRWYHTDYPAGWQVAVAVPLGLLLAGVWVWAGLAVVLAVAYLLPAGRTFFKVTLALVVLFWAARAVVGLFGAVTAPWGIS